MKKSILKNIIREAISDRELSLELSNGKIIHGKARTSPKALSLQIGNNTYFSFWEGKFTLSGTGDVTIVGGVDDYSQEWFLKATEEYLKAMEDAYPEKFKYNTTGPIGMNESTSRDAFMAGWNQSKANLGKGKIKGDLRDIDAWKEYYQGEGSEEEKDAFLDGWFKARTTTDYKAELEKLKMNENISGENYISVNIKKDDGTSREIKGRVEPTDIGFIIYNEKNDGKPYNIIWDRERNKFINGETIWYNVEDVIPTSGYEDVFSKLEMSFRINENKMTKQDIIRIINEEVNLALDEQEKQLYKVVDDKGKVIKPDESSDVDGLVKRIATKLAAKNPKWSVEKINEMYDPIYDTMIPEIAAMLAAGIAGVIKAFKYLKSKGLNDQTIISILNKAKEKVKGNVNENEGMTKSLKDIDPNLSLTKYDTTPPKFKITYIRKDDMSKEMEEELVAWVLSKGGRVDSVETMFDVEDGERYYYPYVKFSYK